MKQIKLRAGHLNLVVGDHPAPQRDGTTLNFNNTHQAPLDVAQRLRQTGPHTLQIGRSISLIDLVCALHACGATIKPKVLLDVGMKQSSYNKLITMLDTAKQGDTGNWRMLLQRLVQEQVSEIEFDQATSWSQPGASVTL